jgi:hypothetical protein
MVYAPESAKLKPSKCIITRKESVALKSLEKGKEIQFCKLTKKNA